MTIVPRPRAPFHTPTPGFAGRRWASRLYPGDFSQTAWVREDLRADLFSLEGLCPDLVDTVVLCASEMFANGVDHSRSGQKDGRVIRVLSMPTADTLHLSVVDDGVRESAPSLPEIPRQRTSEEWEEAERGRGLLLIDSLATRWGTRAVVDFPSCGGLGTIVWAEFTLTPASDTATAEADR
ncbi:ATP-binding protein [Nocardiopsis sp. HUAS JQ3]|uniref:ATP-binding protein n=1 Tax=Nocardiopsis sp. HUAS JQ3 TaxID=3061629 RepID=UPI0023A92A1D|nr:ATP-binding protein [Nocardiopsis sp. HUAS JQ3]WDZ88921.1 ATP-binding protein [Nocardiopsis sp. HUAS JQ3]